MKTTKRYIQSDIKVGMCMVSTTGEWIAKIYNLSADGKDVKFQYISASTKSKLTLSVISIMTGLNSTLQREITEHEYEKRKTIYEI